MRKGIVSNQRYENADGSLMLILTDSLETKEKRKNPTSCPFENAEEAKIEILIRYQTKIKFQSKIMQ